MNNVGINLFQLCPTLTEGDFQGKLTSIAILKDNIYVGTTGFVSKFRAQIVKDKEDNFKSGAFFELRREMPSLKASMTLQVLEDLNLLLVLQDGHLYIYDALSLQRLDQIEDLKNITIMAYGNIAAANKSPHHVAAYNKKTRKIMIFQYVKAKQKFVLIKDLSVQHSVQDMQWCGTSICIACKLNYLLVDTVTGKVTDVGVPIGGITPCILVLNRDQILLTASGFLGIIIDSQRGIPLGMNPLSWPCTPTKLVHCSHYVLAMLPNNTIQVMSLLDQSLVQQFAFPSCLHMYASLSPESNRVIVASERTLSTFLLTPIESQVSQHLSILMVDEALILLQQSMPKLSAQTLEAFHLQAGYVLMKACQFQSAMNHFSLTTIDPQDLIHLYKDLRPICMPGYITKYILNGPGALIGEVGITTIIKQCRHNLNDMFSSSSTSSSSSSSASSSSSSLYKIQMRNSKLSDAELEADSRIALTEYLWKRYRNTFGTMNSSSSSRSISSDISIIVDTALLMLTVSFGTNPLFHGTACLATMESSFGKRLNEQGGGNGIIIKANNIVANSTSTTIDNKHYELYVYIPKRYTQEISFENSRQNHKIQANSNIPVRSIKKQKQGENDDDDDWVTVDKSPLRTGKKTRVKGDARVQEKAQSADDVTTDTYTLFINDRQLFLPTLLDVLYPKNECRISDCEHYLVLNRQYSVLALLYESRSAYRKALEVWSRLGSGEYVEDYVSLQCVQTGLSPFLGISIDHCMKAHPTEEQPHKKQIDKNGSVPNFYYEFNGVRETVSMLCTFIQEKYNYDVSVIRERSGDSSGNGSSFKGKNLGSQVTAGYIDLVWEFARWVLHINPTEGMQIFTFKPLPTNASLDVINAVGDILAPSRVLAYLVPVCNTLLNKNKTSSADIQVVDVDVTMATARYPVNSVAGFNYIMRYLEFIVMECGNVSSIFHTQLANLYVEETLALVTPETLKKPSQFVPRVRVKLYSFLLDLHANYLPEIVLQHTKETSLYLETIILYARTGNHAKALKTYVFDLRMEDAAAMYCQSFVLSSGGIYGVKNENDDENNADGGAEYRRRNAQQMFAILLNIYFSKEYENLLLVESKSKMTTMSNTSKSKSPETTSAETSAFELIRKYSMYIDPVDVIKILPATVPLSVVAPYLSNVLPRLHSLKSQQQISKHLYRTQSLELRCTMMQTKQPLIVIDKGSKCTVCGKVISDKWFCVEPRNKLKTGAVLFNIYHYHCQTKK